MRSALVFLLVAGCSTPPAPAEQETANAAGNARRPFDKPPPEAYLRSEDQDRARRGDIDDYPCTIRKEENGTIYIEGLPRDECVHMTPRQRYRGVWVNEFEGSHFYIDQRHPPASPEAPCAWLDVERVEFERPAFNGGSYLLEIEGRRTVHPGLYGHLGSCEHELIVDRVISMKHTEESPLRPDEKTN
jgi:hypothetical protein